MGTDLVLFAVISVLAFLSSGSSQFTPLGLSAVALQMRSFLVFSMGNTAVSIGPEPVRNLWESGWRVQLWKRPLGIILLKYRRPKMGKRSYSQKAQTWREIARPIVRRVIEEHRGEPPEKIKRALRDAYPFGTRNYYPYRVWLEEVRRELESQYYSGKELDKGDRSSHEKERLDFIAFLNQDPGEMK